MPLPPHKPILTRKNIFAGFEPLAPKLRVFNEIPKTERWRKSPAMNIPWYRISLGEHWKGRREGKTEMAMLIYISYNSFSKQ